MRMVQPKDRGTYHPAPVSRKDAKKDRGTYQPAPVSRKDAKTPRRPRNIPITLNILHLSVASIRSGSGSDEIQRFARTAKEPVLIESTHQGI
jgi:hypothetical protein